MHLQVITTQRCNAVCDFCDKAVGLAKLTDMEMTAQMMRVAVQQSIDSEMNITRVTLSGGEPILNVELQGIIDACVGFPDIAAVRVLTNDMDVSKPKRDKIKLPDDRFRWSPAPIDDTSDPFSGKNKRGVRYRNQVHYPFWISPVDLGLEANWKNCTIKDHCGRGLDSSGWSMCGQAGILGRILGVNPYDTERDPKEHVNTAVDEICKHCRYGLKKGSDKSVIDDGVASGDIPYTISPIYEKALDRFDVAPTTYEIALGAVDG